MEGFLLLADGSRLDGDMSGGCEPVAGWLVANTAVVGFQEMMTDPAYRDVLLALTYPEIGNTGVNDMMDESPCVQPRGLVVRELNGFPSHCHARESLPDRLSRCATTCLAHVDTRALAVMLRRHGEMPGVIAPAGAEEEPLLRRLRQAGRPAWDRPQETVLAPGRDEPVVAVVDLGMRRSFADQLVRCCHPVIVPFDATADALLSIGAQAVVVSDGPAQNEPPQETVALLQEVFGRRPILACGLGCTALGMALGCRAEFLSRGHHGANFPVRNLRDGRIETTAQRHSVVLNAESVQACPQLEIASIHLNDGSVEGVRSTDGSAVGCQHLLAAVRGAVNHHILEFMESL